MPTSPTAILDGLILRQPPNVHVSDTTAPDTTLIYVFVVISFNFVVDAMDKYLDHPFSKLMTLWTTIIAPITTQIDAPADATEDFFLE